MDKLILIDGHAIMYRAFHAMPPLTTKTGEPINAVYGLVSMFINIVENLKPTHIAIAFDEKEKTFRNKLLKTYQSQRPEMPGDLSSQFEKAKSFLKACKIPYYSKPGYEADDVIGTLVTRVTENPKSEILNPKSNEVIIVTGDRDILQLVDDKKNIKLYMPISGLSNGKIFKEKETHERMGVSPSQIPDLKALTGDPSDNYFGVPGIGPKTASNLLLKYRTLDGIYKNLSELPEKLREKLTKGKESAYLSYELATIIRNVPVKFNLEKAKDWNLISEEVLSLFESYGFKTLTARIKALGKKLEDEKQGSLF